jgi:uncharacterized SAM-binding protein YcdF (DUF218 family)
LIPIKNTPLRYSALFLFLIGILLVYVTNKNEDTSVDIEQADVIVCLSGGSGERLIKTLELYHDGLSKNILLTKTRYSDSTVNDFFKNWKVKFLLSQGVDGGSIYKTQGHVSSTYEEVLETNQHLQDMDYSTAIVVSDKNHIPRVQFIFNKVLGDSISLQYVPAGLISSHKNDARMESMLYKIMEIIKHVVYRIKY